jgi:RimJ/RimL family protein N-acetyltransferase
MTIPENEYGQPVGAQIPGWSQPEPPTHMPLAGRSCRVEPLRVADHAVSLFAAFSVDGGDAGWTYLPYGPFARRAEFEAWLNGTCLSDDPLFFAIVDAVSGAAVGMASYLNIKPLHATVEVGHVHFSRSMQRSRIATEAMYLMMGHAFAAGYRRYEWKCDVLNARSRRAARRFGFSYEGVFRQHMVVRGRSRDSAWFACVNGEWPSLKAAYEAWLDDANFDADGNQLQSLAGLTRPVLVATD